MEKVTKEPRVVFVTGATGYMGRSLLPRLLARGHRVRALAREGSEKKLPAGCEPIRGNALEKGSFTAQVPPADTFVQLVGVAHPSPARAKEFRSVDLVSLYASVEAAVVSRIAHFVYVSVARPAPIMKEYQEVRAEGEETLRKSGLNATFLRPWYVLGPGHRWPYVLLPGYWLAERLPATRETARRLGLVTLEQMVRALIFCIENPVQGIRALEVPDIRALARHGTTR